MFPGFDVYNLHDLGKVYWVGRVLYADCFDPAAHPTTACSDLLVDDLC